MSVDASVSQSKSFGFSDLFAMNSALEAAVNELCHYHPMGVYYYVDAERTCHVVAIAVEEVCETTVAHSDGRAFRRSVRIADESRRVEILVSHGEDLL